MRRIAKAAIGGVASYALILGGTQFASGAASGIFKFREDLTDFLTDDGPFDSAKAKAMIEETADGGPTFEVR